MPYTALTRIHIGGGKYREQGELIPEADKWPDPYSWIVTGQIKEIGLADAQKLAGANASANPPEKTPAKTPAAPAPEAAAHQPFKRGPGRPRKSE